MGIPQPQGDLFRERIKGRHHGKILAAPSVRQNTEISVMFWEKKMFLYHALESQGAKARVDELIGDQEITISFIAIHSNKLRQFAKKT